MVVDSVWVMLCFCVQADEAAVRKLTPGSADRFAFLSILSESKGAYGRVGASQAR